MQIIILDPLDAQRWFKHGSSWLALLEVQEWILKKERIWGECYVFLEIHLPRGQRFVGTHSQIDMLITFSDRAALVELKGHRYAILADELKDDVVPQIRGQRSWIVELIGDRTVRQRIYPFLFLHRMFPAEVKKTTELLVDIAGWNEIWCVGAHSKLASMVVGNRPIYLPTALMQRMGTLAYRPHSTGLQQFLLDKITATGVSAVACHDFEDARKHLKYVCANPHLNHEPTYVPDLRCAEQQAASAMFSEGRVLELLGPPGIGKSTLAKEIMRETNDGIVLEISLRACQSVLDVCSKIDSRLNGDWLEGQGDETYIAQLSKEPCTFWLRSYDEESYRSINEFFRGVCAELGSGEANSRWLVESNHGLTSLHQRRHAVKELDDFSISRVIARTESGGAFKDPEEAVERAQGNIRRAIRLWQSKTSDQAADSNEASWFIRQLSPLENQLFTIVCLAASRSPLGVTLKTIGMLADGMGLLITEIETGLEALVQKLEAYQLADITRFDATMFEELLKDVLPPDVSLVLVNNVSKSLVDFYARSTNPQVFDQVTTQLNNVLDAPNTHTDTLSYVTFAFQLDDLEPFFRSSFRFTTLGQVLDWIDVNQWTPPDSRQRYLLKALRVLRQMHRNSPIRASALLGAPDRSDHVQVFASNFVRTRELTVTASKGDHVTFLQKYIPLCRNDSELEVAGYMSLTTSLQNADRPNDAWEILRELPAKYSQGTTANALCLQRALEFLNSKKNRDQVGIEDAYTLIEKWVTALIAEGLRVENVQLLCEAIFDYVRARELRSAQTSFREVLQYRAALAFLEDAPRMRGRQRLKVLLTQGSIHRHYCRDEHIAWPEFRQHLDEGMERYVRALRSARAQGHSMHMLNAVSYMVSFCMRALQFADVAAAREVIAEKTETTMTFVKDLRDSLDESKLLALDKQLYGNIVRNSVVLSYVGSINRQDTFDRSLINQCSECANRLQKEIEDSFSPRDRTRTIKNVAFTLRALNNAVTYGAHCDRVENDLLLAKLRAPLLDILQLTQRFARKGTLLKNWQSLRAFIG